MTQTDVVIVGSGSAALCAAIAARTAGAEVVVIEKADRSMAGGNSKYTAGAMRFAYDGVDDLLPLLADPDDPRLATTDFGSYSAEQFGADLLGFNDGRELSTEQRALISQSLPTMRWLSDNGVKFEPIYERQSFEKDGRHVFWGGLTLAASGEGAGLVDAELRVFERLGGAIRYDSEVTGLITEDERVVGVEIGGGARSGDLVLAGAVVLASGGFEADEQQRVKHLGPEWAAAKVRGTPHNTGTGLKLAVAAGAEPYGFFQGCHATPMDLHMPNYGNLDIPHFERKNYRKICYFLGIMINGDGQRFVDEGRDFRNYTYAQFGGAVLRQPGQFAWQIFDAKVEDLLYGEYRFHDAHFVEAATMDELVALLDGVDPEPARATIAGYNAAVDGQTEFDPTIKDGKSTRGLPLPKSNWAQTIDTPPFKAFPVTGGITFTYGGLRVDEKGSVLRPDGTAIGGLHACGELVGGVFFAGYPGGSGLTSGAVFGRRAGLGAASVALGARFDPWSTTADN
ncbi:MAG: FAD-dependent tricarballylate dehydrogenase TcuA [Acidimicrobiales bacterium]